MIIMKIKTICVFLNNLSLTYTIRDDANVF